MRVFIFRFMLLALFSATLICSVAVAGGSAVGILVLKEHGVGSPTLAQPYLDKFVALAAEQNGWTEAKGQYYTSRSAAEAFIREQSPHYGIFSLAALLAMKEKYHLEIIGQVAVSLVGGRQYAVISKSASDLAGCKGKILASDHIDDARFIEHVVAAEQFKLAEFTLAPTQRPLQTIRKVLTGEAVCALVDDAQLTDLTHIDGADGIHPVWKSAELPPMAVAAFPTAPTAERKRFQDNLSRVCDDDGQRACAEVGIVALHAASAADYAAVLTAYGK